MIPARTKLYAVVGNPVEKSMSPILQNAWMQDHGMDAAYVALTVRESAALASLAQLGFAGVNVTVPFKTEAFALATTACPTAKALQAANVLRFTEAGETHAFNTDAEGLARSLDEVWPNWQSTTKQALLIGAGGAARAAGYSALQRGVALWIINRSEDRATDLASALATVVPGADVQSESFCNLTDAMADCDLIINAMSDDSAMAWDFSNTKARCVDLRYGAMPSQFLAAARRANLETLDGLGMLIHQGALAFEHWFGIAPDTDKARARLLEALR